MMGLDGLVVPWAELAGVGGLGQPTHRYFVLNASRSCPEWGSWIAFKVMDQDGQWSRVPLAARLVPAWPPRGRLCQRVPVSLPVECQSRVLTMVPLDGSLAGSLHYGTCWSGCLSNTYTPRHDTRARQSWIRFGTGAVKLGLKVIRCPRKSR
ncbi:hypothetical protein GGR56DRAFT_32720 [Xylariaceae sp. FL0804]|nr:hypothetical protein GGR56DRAFT_32720 [Xylariaceae sp. FL0804]